MTPIPPSGNASVAAVTPMKPRNALLQPDARFLNMVGGDDVHGAIRMMDINDLYDDMKKILLGFAVPANIIEQFAKAKHAYIYSWFAYDLVSLAEQQGYQTLELALREKLPPVEQQKAVEKLWTLGRLINRAYAHHWLVRADSVILIPKFAASMFWSNLETNWRMAAEICSRSALSLC